MNSPYKQFSLDEKMVSKIHVLPTISVPGIMEYLSVSFGKGEELLGVFAQRIEQGYVTRIKGNLNLTGTRIASLGNLQSVGGYLDLYGTNFYSLGSLQTVGGLLDLQRTKIKSLGKLQTVGGYLNLMGTPLKSLGILQTVGENFYLPKNQIPQGKVSKVQVGGEIIYE